MLYKNVGAALRIVVVICAIFCQWLIDTDDQVIQSPVLLGFKVGRIVRFPRCLSWVGCCGPPLISQGNISDCVTPDTIVSKHQAILTGTSAFRALGGL